VKLTQYAEELLAVWLSRKVGRPVKWTETRSEHMSSTIHGRDQIDYVKIGAKRDGTITGLECKAIADLGAYYTLLTPFIPCFTGFVISGCYKIPNLSFTAVGVFTNKMATDATRGAGRPEATHLIEVSIEQLAAELGMDSLELRRKNFIPKEDFPATVAIGIAYDSGDYHGSLDKLLTHVDVDAFRREQAADRERGVYRGIGFSTWMEICGLAPSRVVGPSGVGLQAGFYESAVVRVHASGAVTAYSGTAPHGQGLDTAFAQIVADRVGATPDVVDVVHGDTGAGPFGLGTYGSRSLAVGGESLARASIKVADKASRIAAHLLEAAPEDVELRDGKYSVKGSPDKGMTLAEVAGAAYVPENLPDGMEPGLEETTFFDPENFVFPFGAHACIVDVDVETGKIDIARYVAVDDCGPAINPMLIDGQVHGGIVHGIGQALFERIHYDENGQLVTGTFVDYALPSAADVPSFETDRTETPSPVNSLGVKGIGEAGTRRPRTPRWVVGRARQRQRRLRTDQPERGRCAVIPAEFDYMAPTSLEEALTALRDGGEDAKVLAGGHSLIPLMKLRFAAPSLLVDLRYVPGLAGIQRENGTVRIGAMTRHVDVAGGGLGLASEAAGTIADPQVRNRGTLGGSVAHGDPASDMPAVLLATEATVTIRGQDGQREVAAADLFQDYLTTAIGQGEVLTEIRMPVLEGYGYGYEKFNRRQEDWAMVAVCALVRRAADGSCEDVRIGLTHMASTPLRATAVESALRGQPLDATTIAAAAEQAAEGTEPPADLNASADYKRHLARVLCRRALMAAAGLSS
jgi:CO/xanthine dehydrogenase FAD-binding subunit